MSVDLKLPSMAAVAVLGCAGPQAPSSTTPPPAPTAAPAPPASSSPAWPPIDDAFLEQQALTHGFKLGRPARITVTPDGDAVLFTRTGPRSPVGDLYSFDVASGRETRLLSAQELLAGAAESLSDEEKARRERQRKATRGIVGFELSRDGKRLLVPLSGKLYLVERAGGKITPLPARPGEAPIDARFSPDGGKVSLVRDGDLYVLDLATGAEKRLTTRKSDDVEHGVAEFVAQEEMDRMEGYWWSPDGKAIAYQRSDVSKMDLLTVSDPARPERPGVTFRYPRVGTANAEVTLGILPAGGGKTTWVSWDRERYPYLARVRWSQNAPLTLVVQNRRQTDLLVLAVDPRTGKTSELLREHDDAWLNLDKKAPRWLDDGSGFLWATERGGRWQLELRRRDGSLARALTAPELGYQALGDVDVDGRAAWVVAAEDPRQAHVWRVPIDEGAGPPVKVSKAEGEHEVFAGERGGVHVITGVRADGALVADVQRRDGEVVGSLGVVTETPPYLPNVEWTTVEVAGRTHHASLVRPRAFDRARRYPVVVYVYGGPTSTMVSLARMDYLADQVFADAGFVVVRTDGRGTPLRGRDWQRAVDKDLITVCITDQADVVKALGARYPELDLGRVGIMGWSFGGYVAALAGMLRPDTFHAAIAGAPVTDWRLYDTHYTERYMGLVDENAAGYDATSALVNAGKLARPLLLIHGTTDDNVYFAHSMRLADALFRAGRHFELLPLNGFTHMVPDPAVKKALIAREVDFMRRALGVRE
jgi:dipeptidyl-peptidase-4